MQNQQQADPTSSQPAEIQVPVLPQPIEQQFFATCSQVKSLAD